MKAGNPRRIFVLVLGASFLVELLIMLIGSGLRVDHFLGPLGQAALNACVFTLVMAPLVWRLVARPLSESAARQQLHSARALRAGSERLTLALEASSTALWDTDAVTGRTLLDEGWAAMMGGPAGETETTLRQLFIQVHPDDRHLIRAAMRDTVEGRTPAYRVEQRMRKASGEWVWIESRGRAVATGVDGTVLRMTGTNTDITARKTAEIEVLQQKEFLETMQQITLELLERRDLEELLLTIVERAAWILDAPFGELMVKEGEVMVVRAFTSNQPYKVAARLGRQEATLSWQAHDTGRPVVVTGYETLPARRKIYDALRVQSVAEFPIMRGATCLGVLSLSRTRPGHDFRAEEIQRGRLFAQMFSLVIHNAGIYADAVHEADARTRALRESEEKFRGVFDKSPIPIALISVPEGRLVEVNAAAISAFGFEDRRFVGRTTTELGLWKNPEERDRYVELLKQKGSIASYDVTMKNARGDEMEILLSGSIIQIDGKPHTLTSLLDITERKRAESKFRDLFEFSTDAIVIIDGKRNITDINRRAQELLGYDRPELIGQNAERIVPEDMGAELREGITHYFTIPGPLLMGTAKGSLQARTKAGRVFPVDISLSPLRSGEAVLVVATLRETTDQRRAEAQQRALELQLRQAQKMDALGTLAGGIAHDFNNLLTVILGNTELAARTSHPAENLAAIREAGLRSKELVAQILTFSRRTEVDRVPTRMQTLIEDALKLLRSTIPVMVRIDTYIDPQCPPVLADPTQIHQVLMNLCTNAWHALPERDGVIEVRLQPALVENALAAVNPDLKPGLHVRLSVSDNGHGMSAGTLERIYEPFFTTKPVGKGTGLGLAVVHGIVQEHAGAIFVRSEAGQGTTFELYFPALAETAARAPEPAAAAAGSVGRGERILYVDDDKLVGDALTELLDLMGFKTTHHLFPREALARFEQNPQDFDLMITDRAMPGMTGGELAAKVLQLRPDLPVLLLTGYADPSMEKELRQIGVREVLGKPLSAQKLADAVRRALSPPAARPV